MAPRECFVPIVSIFAADDLGHALRIHNATPFGLIASVFTRSEAKFRALGEHLEVSARGRCALFKKSSSR